MNRSSSGGCGSFLFLLFLGFLIAKVTGVIDWSWWWVTSPLWLPFALVIVTMALAALMGVSLYRLVVGTLRKQDPAGAKRRSEDPLTDVLEAEGTEVTGSARKGPSRRSLAAPNTDGSEEGNDGGTSP